MIKSSFLISRVLGRLERNNLMKDYLIASYTGSGVAWLLNFFVEINLLVYRGQDISCTWKRCGSKYVLNDQDEVLKQWMPVLSEKTEFNFCDCACIKWAHEFPRINDIGRKVILLVRDGRDTIYSQFRREKIFENFSGMLGYEIEPLNINPPLTWAFFYHSWKKILPKDNVFIIKFEDIKSDPLPILKDLLSFLGISRTIEEIQKGIESSGFERAKKAEEEYRKKSSNIQFDVVNRKGKPGEWKEVYSENELNFFKGFPNRILKDFNYEVVGSCEYPWYLPIKNWFYICWYWFKIICLWPVRKFTILFKKIMKYGNNFNK